MYTAYLKKSVKVIILKIGFPVRSQKRIIKTVVISKGTVPAVTLSRLTITNINLVPDTWSINWAKKNHYLFSILTRTVEERCKCNKKAFIEALKQK